MSYPNARRSRGLTGVERVRIIVGAAVILSVVAFFAYVFFGRKTEPPRLDIDTGCLVDQVPPSQTIVLVDNTDSFSPAQVTVLQKHLEDLHNDITTWGMLTIASIGGDRPPEVLFSRCSPEQGKSFKFLESIRRSQEVPLDIQAAYEKEFQKPVQTLVKRMPLNKTTRYSPIIGSIEDAIDQAGPQWSGARTRNLIIFSDLLENTKEFSQYGSGNNITFAQARSKVPYIKDAQIDLRKTDVTIYYLTGRPTSKNLQNKIHERFWRDLVASYDGHIQRLIRLPMGQEP